MINALVTGFYLSIQPCSFSVVICNHLIKDKVWKQSESILFSNKTPGTHESERSVAKERQTRLGCAAVIEYNSIRFFDRQ